MTLALFARIQPPADTPPPAPTLSGLFTQLDRVETLPHLTDTAVRAMALASDPDATLADMAAVIRRDGVLAATTLKLANSVVYRGAKEVTDLLQAVMRLGQRGTGGVIAAAGVRNLYARLSPAVRGPCESVLRHSLFVGELATAVARFLHLRLNGEEFTAGLLHDIGRVVMCVNAPDHYAEVCTPAYDAHPDGRRKEREAFGTDHCTVGGLFAIKNALPARIARAIQHHHDPDGETEFRSLAGVVALSDAIANHLHLERDLSTFPLEENPGFAILRRLAPGERVLDFRAELRLLVVGCVRQARSVLRSMPD
jgi:putative nucleotidyltransferase with HDIG domain